MLSYPSACSRCGYIEGSQKCDDRCLARKLEGQGYRRCFANSNTLKRCGIDVRYARAKPTQKEKSPYAPAWACYLISCNREKFDRKFHLRRLMSSPAALAAFEASLSLTGNPRDPRNVLDALEASMS
jgi:hypothetical protein